ncbi:competence protein CoiA [Bacillaceae bacterium Marseille-Q3522]|nr:competence protein CoiA [Bacillaceae bacterium Marseille-Q3522]
MLSALNESGKMITLGRMDKKPERKENFYCPVCREKVLLKAGSQKIAHFSHLPNKSCTDYMEAESQYHLSGKLQLYEWLEKLRLQPVLEPYYQNIKQRPDIGFANRFVIEYQCSSIPQQLFTKRTMQYKNHHYHPLWILGEKNIRRKGSIKVSLSKFHYFFLRKNKANQWFIPTYCPQTKQFIFLHHITPVSSRNAFASIQTSSVDSFYFSDFFQQIKPPILQIESWKREIQQQKAGISIHASVNDTFLRKLYRNQLNLMLLPPVVGIPVESSIFIETSPLIWQGYLFIDHFYSKKQGDFVYFTSIYDSFLWHIKKREIRLRFLPQIEDVNLKSPIKAYLRLLDLLGYAKQIENGKYQVLKKIEIFPSIPEQMAAEELFYKKYEILIKSNPFHIK